jgi:Phage tail sheath C-terminal domain
MATLVSPGVSVSVIDESNYAPTGPGTVPFILLATAQDKNSTAGGIANYTTSSTVNTLQLVSSQKELLSNYGLPTFPSDASGNRLFGSELAEYGLMAAHSTLGITNQAYILRANVDLGQLSGSSSRPYGEPAGGTQWLDTATTSYGIFQWDATNQIFNAQTPIVITSTTQLTGGVPYSNVGTVGSYAVVATDVKNPIYQKMYDNSWQTIGSNAWAARVPTIVGNSQATSLTLTSAFSLNGTTFTIANTSVANLVATINSAGLPGVNAKLLNGYFNLFANSLAQSNGSTADGKIAIANTSGTPLTNLGITGGTYYDAALSYGAHYSVPAWKSTDSNPRPSGSIWLKTTAVNSGANFTVYRWNSATMNWDAIPAPVYQYRSTATYNIDPTLGGLGIATDTLFVKYDILGNNTGSYKLLQWMGNGGPLTVTGSVSNPTFTATNAFTIQVTIPGSSSLSSTYTVTLSGTSAASFVSDVLAQNIPYLTCTLTSSNNIQFGHTNGGDIVFVNTVGTPLASAGITTSTTNVYDDASNGTLTGTYWQPAEYLYQQSTAPVVAPSDGTLWYYETPLEVDIMISNGTIWKGYHNVTSDSRGYNLSNTDPLGPIISSSKPTLQTDGTALVYGDIWVNTANLENYPQIYRWQRYNGTDQWILIDNTDSTTENGILFADARWDSAGTADPALDAKPTIVSLLTSDYVDLDVPNPQLYPRGTILFNTRRSSYNVKKFVASKFNSTNYPLQSLPSVASTWQSVSGKNANGTPYMGRKAVRNVVVSALKEAVDNNTTVREDQINFNLLVCPGYPELTSNLVSLNNDRRNTGFILADTPMGLSSDTTSVNNYITNSSAVSDTDEEGLATTDSYTAVFYPGAAYTNALDGVGQVVVPITHAILRMIVKSDQASAPWFAPAGALRGKIDNVTKIGYVDRSTGKFYSIGTNQGLRDLLYSNNVNPVAVFPTEGILNYGNHTRQATATALDRINVARLINYLRYNLERLAKPLVFEPNDTVTRNEASNAVAGLLNNIVAQRGIYDYLVVCDTTNNTPSTIDRNELHIDIAIEPTKAVEFIYIPVRILNTGAIAGTGAGLGGLSNTTPSVSLSTTATK